MRFVRRAAVLWAALSIVACSHATNTQQRPNAGVAKQRPALKRTPAPAPRATPPPAPPRVLPPAAVKHVVRLPPNAAPRILAVAMTETTIHRGDRVSGNVVTTSNVASVQARVDGYAVTLNKIGVGHFTITYTVDVPWFVRGDFDLHVIATNTGGATVERVIPLKVR